MQPHRNKHRRSAGSRPRLFTAVWVVFFSAAPLTAGDEPADLPHIQLVLLTPSAIESPAGHPRRLTELANYTEAFFARWMEYWCKSYVGRVGADGAFQVDVTELAPADGTLRILFCFENGAITGDGKERGLASAIPKHYQYRNYALVFSD